MVNTTVRLIGNETGLYRPLGDPNEDKRFFTAEAVSVLGFTAIMGYLYMWKVNDFDAGSISSMTRACAWNEEEVRFHDVLRASQGL